MLSFVTVHILHNAITIIKACYYIYEQNVLILFATTILSIYFIYFIRQLQTQIFTPSKYFNCSLEAMLLTQFIDAESNI